MIYGVPRDRTYIYIVLLFSILSAWGVYSYAESIIDDSVYIVYPNSISSGTEKSSVIVSTPNWGSIIKSPVKIVGKAPGTWFFEGSLTVKIVDQNGVVIGQGPILAIDNWMTTRFVDFEGSMPFSRPTSEKGYIEFIKEDPKDGSENVSYKLPISFDVNLNAGSCDIGGCSGNICSDDPSVAGTCEWSDEYACYTQALCERQENGSCGWTETEEFKTCIDNVKKRHNEGMI